MGVKIGFIGLGVMGYPMAGWLSKAGHSVTVYNRTGVVGQRWLTEFSGNIANTPGGAAKMRILFLFVLVMIKMCWPSPWAARVFFLRSNLGQY